jgi:hypothetical protein
MRNLSVQKSGCPTQISTLTEASHSEKFSDKDLPMVNVNSKRVLDFAAQQREIACKSGALLKARASSANDTLSLASVAQLDRLHPYLLVALVRKSYATRRRQRATLRRWLLMRADWQRTSRARQLRLSWRIVAKANSAVLSERTPSLSHRA